MCCCCDTSYIVSIHIQCQASIYTLSLCHGHSWRVRLAKQETLTPRRHLVSPLVCRGQWMSTVVLYRWCHSYSASFLLFFTLLLIKICNLLKQIACGNEFITYRKTKRRRSDPVLWQKPLHQQKCQKGKVTTQTTSQKSSIKQQLRTDLRRSVGVTTVTQLVWLTGLRAHLPIPRNSRVIKRTHI